MPRDLAAYLVDGIQAGRTIQRLTSGYDQQRYADDETVRLAVERCFQKIGEVLVELRKREPDQFNKVHDDPRIIQFRNVLVHVYFALDHATVWESIMNHLPLLLDNLSALLRQVDPDAPESEAVGPNA